ncbi:putative 50S ribosome binding GTPase [Trypanosoma vivax]|uniref:EngB-type G domain-containing protein n=1 Tax=Trypanosoma vivax (strain Y486) TaxID=1055687 RepID=G0U9N0_TRYVY|nr:hypothetical protein TRVL_02596 [Trypanosoma vivax]KAH8605108.1 putative 50S ribosome binding GTPase [Trypanosoma vivax]CCC54316.1 conserved hypothetical protein [Trypanosoma vivax Y486]
MQRIPHKVSGRVLCSKSLWWTVSALPHGFSLRLASTLAMTCREKALGRLSEEIFSRGNMHLKNVNALSALPEGFYSFPEVCFIGKPNVGKSSIISCLLHNHRLGRAGCGRGTTRLLQFFNVGDALLLVDTPGYGGWKGRSLVQHSAERAAAFAILFRYMALRKQGPLKRIYWVFESTGSIQPRDEELFAFLQNERLPFSVIVSKVDRLQGDCRALRQRVEGIYDFLGSRDVPVLAVASVPQRPERCIGIDALRCDITYYCSQELINVSDLTLEKIRDLSYSPPTPAEIAAVEQRYQLESFVVPKDDRLSLECFVSQHEAAKKQYLAVSPRSLHLTSKDKAVNHLVSSEVVGASNTNESDLCPNSIVRAQAMKERPQPVSTLQVKANPISDAVSSAAMAGRFRVRASLRDLVAKCDDLSAYPWMNSPLPASSNDGCSPCAEQCSTLPTSCDSGVFVTAGQQEVIRVPLAMDSEADFVLSVNGVRIPRSMISPSVAQLAATQEGSLEHFALMSGAVGYEKFMENEKVGSDIFTEAPTYSRVLDDDIVSFRRLSRKSVRRKRLERVMAKYISRVRKDRSLYLQAEGYMCPWLAGAGQQSSASVVGLYSGSYSVGVGGRMMKGLKRTGFGGRSYSLHTMKNRGRATKKVGFWAA